jgi:two-component system response regulator HydG
MKLNILIADDEEITLKHLSYALGKEGYDVTTAKNGVEALKKIEATEFDVLIADIKMPGIDGITLLTEVKGKYPEVDVIIVTGFGSIESAVNAMSKGATDYVTKPFNLDELTLKVKKIEEKKRLEKENIALKVSLNMPFPAGKSTVAGFSFIAKSKVMRRVTDIIAGIQNSDCNVLISGESGTGKGLVAKLIHYTSGRKERPFLAVNCAIFTEELLASELFGHEKGAFTGAVSAKQGLLEIADNGTLFLDEIAEMTSALQAKLLKVIEDREFIRVGGTRSVKVDVRFIAATNQNLSAIISSGRFREDLYYRLNVMDIYIPPLRERKEDIAPLGRYFLGKHSKKTNKKITGFTEEAMDILTSYGFPGNVRELENIVERAVILEKSTLITPESLPQSIRLFQIETIDPNRIKTIDELNKDYAEKILDYAENNKSKASELLGISRTSLWRILKK